VGGFSSGNLMSLDQRGFKAMIQQEAAEFLSVKQRLLNATVRTVVHSQDGVTVTLANGTTLSADYALCTFSLGVLQHDDVQFHPLLPRELFLPLFIPFLLLICGTFNHQNSNKKLFKGW
jgi:polyamine oxidase